MRSKHFLILLIVLAAGCGQKGPLFLPGDVSGGTLVEGTSAGPVEDDEESKDTDEQQP